MDRPDHSEAEFPGHDVVGGHAVDGCRNPADPVSQGPIDREEALALRRQERVNPRRLQRPRPPLLKRGGDAGLARATRAIENDASCRHRSRIPQIRLASPRLRYRPKVKAWPATTDHRL